ncbi:MAG: cyclic nucleotide-binding domain-containing protein [Devosia sp.]|nr:cyclic nucleotide-binding domain-containing protein [Devosia sp.]
MQLDPSAFLADPDLISALQKRATPFVCEQDRVLFRQGDPPTGLFILRKGLATLTMDPGASQNVFACHAVPGSLLGVPGLIGNQPYSLTAVAQSGAEVSFIARDDFNLLMQTEQRLMLMILQVLAAEVRSARLALAQL